MSPARYFKMRSLDHIYGSTWQKRNWDRTYSWHSLGSGWVPVLNVLFSTGRTIFCRERSSRHSLGQAESSGKDDISHCQQVPWYLHLPRVITQEPPSLTDEPQEPILCVPSTEITGIICINMHFSPLLHGMIPLLKHNTFTVMAKEQSRNCKSSSNYLVLPPAIF